MLYVQQSLGPDEQLYYIGHFHWIYDVKSICSIVFGLILAVMIVGGTIWLQNNVALPFLPPPAPAGASVLEQVRTVPAAVKLLSFLMFVFGLLRYAHLMVTKVTTEIAITNTRLIYKRGLVARYVGEMSIDRIESVNVLQSFWGRILDYGQLAIRGMGVGEVILPPIAQPINFRKAIEKAKQSNQNKGES